jgi:impB/mucB/samB family C-terminal domain
VVRGERDRSQRDLRSRCCYLSVAFTKARATPEPDQLLAHRTLIRLRKAGLALHDENCGTKSSNPLLSSAESAANFVFGREAWKGPRRRQGTIPTVSTSSGTDGSNPAPSSAESGANSSRPRTLRDARSGWKQRPVRADRIRKSVGAENTFPTDLFTYEAARDALREIIDKVWGYSERSGIRGRTVTLKVKFANFRQITRSRTGQTQIKTRSELEQLGNALLNCISAAAQKIGLRHVPLAAPG